MTESFAVLSYPHRDGQPKYVCSWSAIGLARVEDAALPQDESCIAGGS